MSARTAMGTAALVSAALSACGAAEPSAPRPTHTGAPVQSSGPEPISLAEDSLAAVPSGKDLGACLTGAKDWVAAQAWVRGMSSSAKDGEHETYAPELNRTFLDRPVRVLVQRERPAGTMREIQRVFVVVETPNGFAGCKVIEEDTLREIMSERTMTTQAFVVLTEEDFSLRVNSLVTSGSKSGEEVEWRVRCNLRRDRLGCIAMPTWWDPEPLQGPPMKDLLVPRSEWMSEGFYWDYGTQRYFLQIISGRSAGIPGYPVPHRDN